MTGLDTTVGINPLFSLVLMFIIPAGIITYFKIMELIENG